METTRTKPIGNKSSFSIANILEHKTHTVNTLSPPAAHSNAHNSEHLQSHAQIINATSPSIANTTTNTLPQTLQSRIVEPIPPTIANTIATTAYSTLSPDAQYAFKNPLLKSDHGAGGTVLLPSSNALRFEPVYDPTSLIYQQMLNMQKDSALFIPHFQAAVAAAAVIPSGYCDQYNSFSECEGE